MLFTFLSSLREDFLKNKIEMGLVCRRADLKVGNNAPPSSQGIHRVIERSNSI